MEKSLLCQQIKDWRSIGSEANGEMDNPEESYVLLSSAEFS
jgi:hypothetical protein